MKNRSIFYGVSLLTIILCLLCSPAKAQTVTFEHRTDSACASAETFNETGKDYVTWTELVRIESTTVGTEPALICAYDTNGDGYLDESRNDTESCEKAEAEGREATSIAADKKAEPFKHREIQYIITKKR